MRERHAAFQTLLQKNLTVMATAHAVSEGIIRGVSGEIARKRAPSTYGATGRASAPAPSTSQPLASAARFRSCRLQAVVEIISPVTVSIWVPSAMVRILVLLLR